MRSSEQATRCGLFTAEGWARRIGAYRGRGPLIDYENFCAGEWIDWYDLTPAERWSQSARLCQEYLALGVSLDPAPNTQSPFDDPETWCEGAADGRPGLHIIRSGRDLSRH